MYQTIHSFLLINATLYPPSFVEVTQSNENVSHNSASSKNDKSHIAKIEDYISKKYDEVALQHLKRELLKEINNEVSCKSVVNSNESLVISFKEHIVLKEAK